MKINQNINKLLYTLKQEGQFYKISSFQFYSEKNNKYCTKYQVMKKQLIEVYKIEEDKIKKQETYKIDYECYSRINLMKYLAEQYRKGSEADGR